MMALYKKKVSLTCVSVGGGHSKMGSHSTGCLARYIIPTIGLGTHRASLSVYVTTSKVVDLLTLVFLFYFLLTQTHPPQMENDRADDQFLILSTLLESLMFIDDLSHMYPFLQENCRT